VTGYGPPDDPSEAPTGYYDYSEGDQPPPQPPSPWYRNPMILVGVGLVVAILLGLAFYLIADRSAGQGGTTQTPTSPTTSATTPATTPTTTDVTTTEPVAPPETTTFPPSTTEPTTAAPTTNAPTTTTSVDEGHHHHHHHDGGTP
jgi:cytoskeletal protein RodZ